SLDLCGGGRGAVALAFELEQAAVEVAAELEKAGQVEVGEQPADPKVVGVVEGGLGSERPSPFQVLLDRCVAVLNVEADLDTLVEDAGAEGAAGARLGRYPAAEDGRGQVGGTGGEAVGGGGGEERARVVGG